MQNAWARTICRLLIALTIWTPFQIASAGMIVTDQAAASTAQLDRGTVLSFLARSDVASQLQALGIDPATAKDRVAAMSDREVQSLAGQINAMPAGGLSSGVLLLLIVIAAAAWWFTQR